MAHTIFMWILAIVLIPLVPIAIICWIVAFGMAREIITAIVDSIKEACSDGRSM